MCNDTFPFYDNGTWHLFVLRVPAIAHYSSRDLFHWKEHPDVAPSGAPGGVVEHNGTFYYFYTFNQTIALTTSPDLEHWTPYEHNPVLTADGVVYDRGHFRDPYVFFNAAGEVLVDGVLFAPSVAARATRGCVGLAKSSDLLHWKAADPLWAPGTDPHLECPQVIQHEGRWYLTVLARHTRCRFADSPNGPWQRSPVRDLGTLTTHAGSRLATDGKRWISWPFILTPPETSNDLLEEVDWLGGPTAVPRQWTFHKDGSVTQRPADEIIQAMHAAAAGSRRPLDGAKPLIGRWELIAGQTARSNDTSGGTLKLSDYPEDFYLEAQVVLDQPNSNFNLLLNIDEGITRGYQLTLHPDRDMVTLRHVSFWDGIQSRVLETQSIPLDARKPIRLRVFRFGTVLDVFVDDKTTLTYQLLQYRDGGMALEFRDGKGTIRDILVRRLTAPRM